MENNNLKVLLFDVSPFLYVAYFGATYILNNMADISNDSKMGRVAGNILMGKIQNCFQLVSGQKVLPIFCYDGKNSIQKKKAVDENYKANRAHPITKAVRKELMDRVALFPGYHITNDNEEADDLIATCKNILKNKVEDCEFLIFSKDNDLLQLCDYRTSFFDPAQGKGARDREYLKEKFNGIDNFKHIILHKVCFGDKSDNIEGVFKGKRRKAIVDKIKTCSKFSQFLESEFFDSEELKEQAKDLYSIIRLKENLDFEYRFNPDTIQVDVPITLEKVEIKMEE